MDHADSTWPPGDGEMAARIRAYDWAASPLGAIEDWPQSLKTIVDLMLGSDYAMQLAWGPARTTLYNDVCASVLGERHPGALGLPFHEAWPDIWDEINPLVARVFAGETVRFEDMPLVMARHGYPEDTAWIFSGSPVRDETGAVAGLLNIWIDTSGRLPAKRSEQADATRRPDEDKYRALFDTIDLGIARVEVIFDPEGRAVDFRWLEINNAIERNSALAGALGATVRELWPAVDPEPIERFAEVLHSRQPIRIERYLAPLGKWLSLYATPAAEDSSDQLILVFIDISPRKEAEAALRESEARFRLVADNISQLAWTCDSLGNVNWYNQRWFDYTGMSFEEMRSWGWEKVQHPDHVARVVAGVERAAASGEPWEDTFPLRRYDGEYRWFYSQAVPIRDPDGAIVQWFGTNTDITDRRRAEEALRESEVRFRALVTAGSFSIYRMSPDWRLMYQLVSPDVLEDTLEPIEDWVEKYIPDEDLPAVRETIAEAIRTKSLFELEHRVRLEDGGIGWVMSRAVPLLDEAGAVVEWFGAGSDVTLRKQAEEAMHEAEERQRLTIELVPALLWSASPDAQEVTLNERWLAYTGQSEAEAQNYGWLNAIHPDDLPGTQAAFERAFATGEPLERQQRIRKADKGYRWHLIRHVPIRDEQGSITRWFGAAVDIQESKLAEEALRESEERFREFGENSSDALWIVDVETMTLEYLSRAFERIWGESRQAVMADLSRWGELVHPEDQARASEAMPHLLAGEAFVAEYRIVRPDGEVRWIRDSGFPIKDHGVVKRAAGIAQDVTELKRAEAALGESEARLRQFGEASQDVLWIRDAETLQWTYLTPAFETIYGVSRQEALEGNNFRGWLDFIVPEDRAYAVEMIRRVRDGEHVTFEFRIRRPSDGAVRWLRNTDFPMMDESGTLVLIGGIGEDITAQKHNEERLKTLLAELQHRVRNILFVIRSVFTRTVETGDDVEDMAEHFRGRLDALARTQIVVTQNARGSVNLEDLVRDELLSVSAGDGPRLSLEGPDVELTGEAAEALGLAVHELTTNSVKYGALGFPDASLAIRWSLNMDYGDSPRLVFIWEEQGVPALAARPERQGFGTELITQALPYRLGAETSLEFRGGGVRCMIAFPLPDTESRVPLLGAVD